MLLGAVRRGRWVRRRRWVGRSRWVFLEKMGGVAKVVFGRARWSGVEWSVARPGVRVGFVSM